MTPSKYYTTLHGHYLVLKSICQEFEDNSKNSNLLPTAINYKKKNKYWQRTSKTPPGNSHLWNYLNRTIKLCCSSNEDTLRCIVLYQGAFRNLHIIIIKSSLFGMHHQCVAPLAANSPHSGLSRAISINILIG